MTATKRKHKEKVIPKSTVIALLNVELHALNEQANDLIGDEPPGYVGSKQNEWTSIVDRQLLLMKLKDRVEILAGGEAQWAC